MSKLQDFHSIPEKCTFWLPEDSQDTRVGIKHFGFTKINETQGKICFVVAGKASDRYIGETRDFDPETLMVCL